MHTALTQLGVVKKQAADRLAAKLHVHATVYTGDVCIHDVIQCKPSRDPGVLA
jgi:hypothetical protein